MEQIRDLLPQNLRMAKSQKHRPLMVFSLVLLWEGRISGHCRRKEERESRELIFQGSPHCPWNRHLSILLRLDEDFRHLRLNSEGVSRTSSDSHLNHCFVRSSCLLSTLLHWYPHGCFPDYCPHLVRSIPSFPSSSNHEAPSARIFRT